MGMEGTYYGYGGYILRYILSVSKIHTTVCKIHTVGIQDRIEDPSPIRTRSIPLPSRDSTTPPPLPSTALYTTSDHRKPPQSLYYL
ncbi:hypothetical protein E2P81_ATG08060 [Venturia nashicola]|uniref:Uncharacterized protein n=1 Tax=Venturia nashicola TaxID=86259 RepID=A0A4Z1NSR4_9PEZI|nr:hypothetical protein E6O75_ATG08233 [Venturia nashicola]TLD26248.1 hypothetical protein E2P81_ATG08060 [Venturia nashicola]